MRFSVSFVFVSAVVALAQANPTGAFAAQVDPNDFATMSADARSKGFTPVVVHLAAVSLSEMNADIRAVKARMAALAAALTAELGLEASTAGRWENGIGQLGLNLTPAGLKLLQNSSNAMSFYPGQPWYTRTALSGQDGRLLALEQQLSSRGYADAQLVLNVDGLEFDVEKNGAINYRGNGQAATTLQQARRLLEQFSGAQAIGKEAVMDRLASTLGQSSMATPTPEFSLRVNREGLEKLAASQDVRSLKPVGFEDMRSLSFDAQALSVAQKRGQAEVVITVRTPLAGGAQSRSSQAASTQSNKRTLDAVLSAAGVRSPLKDLSGLGAMVGHLSHAELRALRANADPRLLSVALNKPVADTQLMTSTVASNFTSAWAAGYRGAGQNIVVMDTGVQRNHKFFQGANGLSKVVYEACFGSNTLYNNINYESNCPNQVGATGDSPPGMAGSAAPRLNCVPDSSSKAGACHHGTHVAGISAGRNSSTYIPSFQGVANEANLIAVQVFSFDKQRAAAPTSFDADLLAAMQLAVSAVNTATTNNPYTINLSLGKDVHSVACPSVNSAFSNAVQALFSAGVPVIAATGNLASRSGVSWPACVPRVVKVGAVENTPTASTISSFTNLGSPTNFPGDLFWLAPGGGGASVVTSSINGTVAANGWMTSTGGMSGTSQATPHVAGLYALVKAAVPGIAVNDISNWIQANGTVPLPPTTVSGASVVFRRLRLPNF